MAEKNKGGRPRFVFTKRQIKEIERLASVLTKAQMADYYGIQEKTFRAAEERQIEVFTAYKKGRAKTVLAVANNLVNQANDGNMTAAIFYLKTQAGWKEETGQNNNESAQPLNINFTVSQPVSDIQVTRGEKPDGA